MQMEMQPSRHPPQHRRLEEEEDDDDPMPDDPEEIADDAGSVRPPWIKKLDWSRLPQRKRLPMPWPPRPRSLNGCTSIVTTPKPNRRAAKQLLRGERWPAWCPSWRAADRQRDHRLSQQ